MTAASALPVAVPAAKSAGIPNSHIILLEGHQDGFVTLQDLLALGKDLGVDHQSLPFKLAEMQSNKELCGFYSFSSGTTGLPKAVSASETLEKF